MYLSFFECHLIIAKKYDIIFTLLMNSFCLRNYIYFLSYNNPCRNRSLSFTRIIRDPFDGFYSYGDWVTSD